MINPYNVPKKIKGVATPNVAFRMNGQYKQALTELAEIESKKYGIKIGQAVLIVNLSTRNGTNFEEQRSWLRQRIRQLKQEQKQHEGTNTRTAGQAV